MLLQCNGTVRPSWASRSLSPASPESGLAAAARIPRPRHYADCARRKTSPISIACAWNSSKRVPICP